MAFRNPEILYGLFALAIPVIIHLFNFRKYTLVYFSSIRQLASIQKDTKSKSKLKNLLILLSRMLLFAALVIAFANPYLPAQSTDNTSENSIIGVYLDNSFSQEALNEQGNLFAQAVNQIITLAQEFPAGQKLVLLTNDREPRFQRIISSDQLVRYAYELQMSGSRPDLALVHTRFNAILNELEDVREYKRKLWVFSDFQRNSFDIPAAELDSSIEVSFFPIQPNQFSTVSVDSCWFENMGHLPNEPEKLFVKISNHASMPVKDLPVRLFLNDSLKAVTNVSIGEQAELITEISYQQATPGFVQAHVQVDDYPVVFDNDLYFSYTNNKTIAVLEITDQPDSPWKALFNSESCFSYQQMLAQAINYSLFDQFDLIICNELKSISSGLRAQMLEYSGKGGNIIIVPGQEIVSTSYDQLMEALSLPGFQMIVNNSTQVSLASLQHPYLKESIRSTESNPRLPYFKSYRLLNQGGLRAELILKNELNQALVYQSKTEQAHFLIFTASLRDDNSNLFNHPLVVPLVFNFAFQSSGISDLYSIIARNSAVTIPSGGMGEGIFSLQASSDSLSFRPDVRSYPGYFRLETGKYIQKAGNYSINFNDDKVGTSSWNYHRKESELAYFSSDEMEMIIEDNQLNNIQLYAYSEGGFLNNPVDSQQGTPLWKYFLYIALFSLLAELILVNWKQF